MRPRLWLAVAAGAAAGLACGEPARAQRPPAASFEAKAEDVATFPDLPGRDEAFGYCGACHAFRLVANQGLSRERWDSSIAWMSEKHAMPPLEPADREVILNYLAKAFPPREPTGGRGGWTNPFAPK